MSFNRLLCFTVAAFLPVLALADDDPYALASKACEQSDVFVKQAVIDRVKAMYAEEADAIERYVQAECREEALPSLVEAQEELAEDPEPTEEEEEVVWMWGDHRLESGELAASADWQTGDNEEEDLMVQLKLQHGYLNLRNLFEASVRTENIEGQTTQEEYRFLLNSAYEFAPRWLAFAEFSYVDDRFSGFDSRISQLLGLGYIIYDLDDFYWETRAGAGLRQDTFVDGTRENAFTFTWENDVDWQFADGWALEQRASFAFSGQSNIYESETSLKSDLTDTLKLRVSYFVEYIDDAPEGTSATDTRTSVGVVYEF